MFGVWCQSAWCVASTLTFDLGCGHGFGICCTVDLCRFCVLSLHREVVGVKQYTITHGKDNGKFR